MGNVIAVTAGKGGSGKSTFAVNIGAALASRGAATILLDLNCGERNLDIYMGLESKVLFDLSDVLTGMCSLEKAIIRDDRFKALSLLSCPQYKSINGMTAQHVKAITDRLRKIYEYVIIDCPGGMGSDFIDSVSCADTALIIVTPDHVSVRNSDVVDRRLEALGIGRRFLAVNMYNQGLMTQGILPDINVIRNSFAIPIAGTLPYDPEIMLGNNDGYPAMCSGNTPVARTFMNIALKLAGKM